MKPSAVARKGADDRRRSAPIVAGFFAARGGLPSPAGAPTVQAQVAFDWVERVL